MGIYAFNLYIRGKPVTIVVDDYIPLGFDNAPIFANIGMDGALWIPLLEKAWAKINGSYERTNAGWMHEAMRVISGAPSRDFLTKNYDADEIYSVICEASSKDYLVGAGTTGSGDHNLKTTYGLSQSHAYTVLGCYSVTDERGVIHELVQMRNPWRFETYKGPWMDHDSRWTPYVRA